MRWSTPRLFRNRHTAMSLEHVFRTRVSVRGGAGYCVSVPAQGEFGCDAYSRHADWNIPPHTEIAITDPLDCDETYGVWPQVPLAAYQQQLSGGRRRGRSCIRAGALGWRRRWQRRQRRRRCRQQALCGLRSQATHAAVSRGAAVASGTRVYGLGFSLNQHNPKPAHRLCPVPRGAAVARRPAHPLLWLQGQALGGAPSKNSRGAPHCTAPYWSLLGIDSKINIAL